MTQATENAPSQSGPSSDLQADSQETLSLNIVPAEGNVVTEDDFLLRDGTIAKGLRKMCHDAYLEALYSDKPIEGLITPPEGIPSDEAMRLLEEHELAHAAELAELARQREALSCDIVPAEANVVTEDDFLLPDDATAKNLRKMSRIAHEERLRSTRLLDGLTTPPKGTPADEAMMLLEEHELARAAKLAELEKQLEVNEKQLKASEKPDQTSLEANDG